MKTLTIILFLTMAQTSFAFEKEDTFSELQGAIMQSNLDYNQTKQQELDEDNDRVSDWGSREVTSIQVETDIQVEARDYKVMHN